MVFMWMFPWSLFFDTDNLRSYEKKRQQHGTWTNRR